jgi:hypothetical protein
VKEIATILKENFPDYPVSTKQLRFVFAKIASFFDENLKFIMPNWNREILLDNNKSVSILGMTYRDV